MKPLTDWDTGFISSEDPTCAVYCGCNTDLDPLWTSDNHWTECPACHRKYRTEFICNMLEPDEREP